MPLIRLPDNSTRNFNNPVTIDDIAKDIGAGLAKAAVAGKIDGQLVDASEIISDASTNLPSIFPAIVALASPGPISLAI